MQDRTKLENYIESYKERRYMDMTNAYEQEQEAKEIYLKAYVYCQQHPENVDLQERTEVLRVKLERIRNNGKKRGYLTNRAAVKSSFNVYRGMNLNIREEEIERARQAVSNEDESTLLHDVNESLKILTIYERRERKGLSQEERKAVITKRQPQKRG